MKKNIYSHTLILPGVIIFGIFFIIPTILSFFFSFTVWTLDDWRFTGLDNFITFFQESSLRIGFKNTLLYAGLTCGLKVVLGLLMGVLLVSDIKSKNFIRSFVFFPHILSTVAVGLAFSNLMHPSRGLINRLLGTLGIMGPDWLGNPDIALFSIILVDLWKGLGMSTVIYIAGIMSIPKEYTEALQVDGGNAWDKFWHITLPLVKPSMNSVIILSFIGGLRSFDLIWAMTQGGPGFATDVIASIIYKQYAAGFYGLSTAGNVVLFILIALLAFPLYSKLTSREVDA